MTPIDAIAFAIVTILLIFCLWLFIQNQITFHERNRVIDAVFAEADWPVLKEQAIDGVTYQQHLLRRLLLRSPWSLYSERVQQLLKEQT